MFSSLFCCENRELSPFFVYHTSLAGVQPGAFTRLFSFSKTTITRKPNKNTIGQQKHDRLTKTRKVVNVTIIFKFYNGILKKLHISKRSTDYSSYEKYVIICISWICLV